MTVYFWIEQGSCEPLATVNRNAIPSQARLKAGAGANSSSPARIRICVAIRAQMDFSPTSNLSQQACLVSLRRARRPCLSWRARQGVFGANIPTR